ncbi:MAG: DUF1127 domain-containing protein [Oceanospirillaceae bacterium]|uniref:DUF1127 domain-containing protein n=1 Tax=Marinobacterium litorale TaxID=404770 RepID=UPI0003FDDBC1|nr:DUF1127 domain-containing protein [Marinobacterium litorale]MBT00385.1 DUF1127 domain-containing protein [Oceanospirillaceae bacterium]
MIIIELLSRLVEALRRALQRRRTRQRLLTLTDRELWDVGISRSDAIAEGRKPFWRA